MDMISIMSVDPALPAPWDRLPQALRRGRTLDVGETLFREGARSRGPWVVLDGTLELVRHGAPGERVPVHRARAGESLAEGSLFASRYHCDAVATDRARVVGFDRAAVLERFGADPDFARTLAAALAADLQRARRRVQLLSIRSAETRVLEAVGDGLLDGGVARLAAALALTTPEATSRALAALVRRGALERIGRGRFVALAPPGTAERPAERGGRGR